MVKRLLLSLCLLLIIQVAIQACKIEYSIVQNAKEAYSIGEEIIIEIKVTFTHRVCPVALEETKFKYKGIQILGATKWKQESAMIYSRKIKTKVIESNNNKILITAERTCDNEGGFGTLELITLN